MKKATEKLLFKTVEGAMEHGANRNYGEFYFDELYKLIEDMEKEIKSLKKRGK